MKNRNNLTDFGDLTERLHSRKLNDLQEEVRQKIKANEDIPMEKIEKISTEFFETVGQLERNTSSLFEEIQDIQERIEEREANDKFQRYYRDNAVDADDYDRLKELNRMKDETITYLLLIYGVLGNLAPELRNAVKEQEMIHDTKYVLKHVSDMTDIFRSQMEQISKPLNSSVNRFNEVTEKAEKHIDKQQQEIEELKDQIEKLKKLYKSEND